MVTHVQSEYLGEVASARSSLYRLLAEVYAAAPSPDLLASLRKWAGALIQDAGTLEALPTVLRSSIADISRFLAENEDVSGEEISVEFTRLFRGVRMLYSPLPPYESVYREGEGHVYDETTVSVRQEFRRFGLEIVENLRGEPPDHISFELEFMCCLCRAQSEAWEKGDEDGYLQLMLAQRRFMESHVLAWVPKFCGEIRTYAKIGLFRGLADLTESWINFDYEQHLLGIEE